MSADSSDVLDEGLHRLAATGPEPQPPDVLTDRAVAAGDAHAIKLTEACLRLHAQQPDPVFLHAAARASELPGWAGPGRPRAAAERGQCSWMMTPRMFRPASMSS